MRKSITLLAAAASIALIAGCSSGASTTPAGSMSSHSSIPMSVHHGVNYLATRGDIHPSVGHVLPAFHGKGCGTTNLAFISDFNNSVVNIYANGTMCAQITGLLNPQGLKVDNMGNLWIADTGNSRAVEFKPPYNGSPAVTLNDTGYYPTDIALCKGYEAITNIFATNGSAGNVEIYKGSDTNPTSTLTDSNTTSERFDTCDASGNLFTTYVTNNGTGGTNEWVGGKGNPKELSALGTNFPGGIRTDNGGKLYVDDQTNRTIAISAPPYTSISKTVTLSGAGDPVSFAVSVPEATILTADASNNAGEYYNFRGNNTGSLAGNSSGLPIGAAFFNI